MIIRTFSNNTKPLYIHTCRNQNVYMFSASLYSHVQESECVYVWCLFIFTRAGIRMCICLVPLYIHTCRNQNVYICLVPLWQHKLPTYCLASQTIYQIAIVAKGWGMLDKFCLFFLLKFQLRQ